MITPDHVRAAMALVDFNALEAQQQMTPRPRGRNPALDHQPPRNAAVLVLVYPHTPDDWRIILTLRTDKLRKHSGQVSFPGGSRDEDDESYAATALRETCEELGLDTSGIVILGMLNNVYIPPTHYDVYPVVATIDVNILPLVVPADDEVAAVLTLPLDDLLRPATRQHEMREIMGYNVSVPYYAVEGHKVWGATAVMLGELEARLRRAVPEDILARL